MLAWVIKKDFIEKSFPNQYKGMECFGDCNEFNIVVPLWSGRECPAQERTVLTTGLFTKLHSRLLEMQRKSLKDFKKACVPAILAFQKDQFVYGRQNRCLGCSFLFASGGASCLFPITVSITRALVIHFHPVHSFLNTPRINVIMSLQR